MRDPNRASSALGLRGRLAALLLLHALGCSRQSVSNDTPQRTSTMLTSGVAQQRQPALQEGELVPELPVVLQDGFQLYLRALKGKLIAIYFCPELADPACVRETLGLQEHWDELHEEHHVVMLGVSAQDAATQRAFIAQHKLQFDLGSDLDHRLAQAFAVPTHGNFAPRLFLVGKDSKILSIWSSADPSAQARAILDAARD